METANARLLIAGVVGALVAMTLGLYGSIHDPAADLSITLGFADTITMKVWLASLSVLFALVQLVSALRLYGKLSTREAPAWLGPVHRMSGRLAFLVSLPVAYHCLYQLAFQDSTTRVLAALDPRLRVLRRVRGQGRRRALADAARPRAAARRRDDLQRARRDVDHERPVVHLRERLPGPVDMLAGLDRVLAVVTWVAAALVVVALFAGPALIGAEKEGAAATPAPAGEPAAAPGQAVFASSCASCHTLAAADASGAVGPNLDERKPDAARGRGDRDRGRRHDAVVQGQLSAEEIKAVAEFVATSAGR